MTNFIASFSTRFLAKFLLLLSASLSIHSALALPLYSVLSKNYNVVAPSVEHSEQRFDKVALQEFSYHQRITPQLHKSLLILLQQDHNNNRIIAFFIIALNQLGLEVTHALIKQTYQDQLITHTHIQGKQNTLYVEKPSYHANLQSQQKFS